MKLFEANITSRIIDFFTIKRNLSFDEINSEITAISGIIKFFENEMELSNVQLNLSEFQNLAEESDRAEYGDFQTNLTLANKVCKFLKNKHISPQIVIEPTCGKGNFILAAIQNFENIRQIFGIEIYKPYVWQTKFNVFDYFLNNPERDKPKIEIINFNVFEFNFKKRLDLKIDNVLILGNPPWVTNSMFILLPIFRPQKKVNVT